MSIKKITRANGTSTPDELVVDYAIKDSAGNVIATTYAPLSALSSAALTGNYGDLNNKPTKLSDFTNDIFHFPNCDIYDSGNDLILGPPGIQLSDTSKSYSTIANFLGDIFYDEFDAFGIEMSNNFASLRPSVIRSAFEGLIGASFDPYDMFGDNLIFNSQDMNNEITSKVVQKLDSDGDNEPESSNDLYSSWQNEVNNGAIYLLSENTNFNLQKSVFFDATYTLDYNSDYFQLYKTTPQSSTVHFLSEYTPQSIGAILCMANNMPPTAENIATMNSAAGVNEESGYGLILNNNGIILIVVLDTIAVFGLTPGTYVFLMVPLIAAGTTTFPITIPLPEFKLVEQNSSGSSVSYLNGEEQVY